MAANPGAQPEVDVAEFMASLYDEFHAAAPPHASRSRRSSKASSFQHKATKAYELAHDGRVTTPTKAKKWYQCHRRQLRADSETERDKAHAWYTASLGDCSNAHARARDAVGDTQMLTDHLLCELMKHSLTKPVTSEMRKLAIRISLVHEKAVLEAMDFFYQKDDQGVHTRPMPLTPPASSVGEFMTELALLNTTLDMYIVLAMCIPFIAEFASTQVMIKAKEAMGPEIIAMAMLAPSQFVQWAPYEAVEAVACTLALQQDAFFYSVSSDDGAGRALAQGTIAASRSLLYSYMDWSYALCENDQILCGCATEHVNHSFTTVPRCMLVVRLLEAWWHREWEIRRDDDKITSHGVFFVKGDKCTVERVPQSSITIK